MNALKHGLRAEKYLTLVDEAWDEFVQLEAALTAELAPEGALQGIFAERVARAAWRLMRADRLEAEVFAERHFRGGGPGLALIRDTNGSRTVDTLLRYRGAAMAEFTRALRTLKALQAEAAATTQVRAAALTLELMLEPKRRRAGAAALRAPAHRTGEVGAHVNPIEPEAGGDRGDPEPMPPAGEPGQAPVRPAHVSSSEPKPVRTLALARLGRGSQPNEPRVALAEGGAAAEPSAKRAAPGAIASPRARRNPAARLGQPSRSTP